MGHIISVFTKPWPDDTIDLLAERVAGMGFDGVELAVRSGYQVTPDRVADDLPRAVQRLAALGITVHSVASDLTETVFAACSEASVSLVRIQVPVPLDIGYFGAKDTFRRQLDTLSPLCRRYGVTIGVQIHSGRFLARSTEIMETIGDYDPSVVSAVWDSGHAAICGEEPTYGMAVCGEHLALVNFKNYRYENSPDGWKPISCGGDNGISSWQAVVEAADARRYTGPFCVSAQYAAGEDVESLARDDCAYLRRIIGR